MSDSHFLFLAKSKKKEGKTGRRERGREGGMEEGRKEGGREGGEREERKKEKERPYSQTGFQSQFCPLLTHQDFTVLPCKTRRSPGD